MNRVLPTVREVENTFDLVMIYELLHESIVLLAKKLCIPVSSITFLKASECSKKVKDLYIPCGRLQIKWYAVLDCHRGYTRGEDEAGLPGL